MIGQLQSVLLSVFLTNVLADQHTDFSGQAAAYTNYNTYYPDYGYSYNSSLIASNPRNKRIFNDGDFAYRLSTVHIYYSSSY